MKPRTLIIIVTVAVGVAVCIRLGFWQLSRWESKRAANLHLEEQLEGDPTVVDGERLMSDSLPSMKLEVRGRYDERHQILLRGRPYEGSPGVHVVTPLLLDGDSTAVLVNRGWVPSSDGATADVEMLHEPGPQVVIGVALELPVAANGPPWILLQQTPSTIWSARDLERDSLDARMPFTLAPWVIQQLPGAGVPASPRRFEPPPLNAGMNLGYAVQWFAIAAILLIGPLALAMSRRRARQPR